MADKIEKMIAETFLEMAQGLETGSFGKRPKIALTGMGSEHGEENAMEAALMAAKEGIDVYYIGSLEAEGVTTVKVADDEEGHKKMEEMLANKEVDGAVTMHFPFPIGVSTVGRAITPSKGKEMFVANTTGTWKCCATTQAMPIPDASIVRILLIGFSANRRLNSAPIASKSSTSI